MIGNYESRQASTVRIHPGRRVRPEGRRIEGMKSLLACLLLPAFLVAQPVVTLTGPGTVTAGGSATLTVACSGCAAGNVPAIQWTLGQPTGFTFGAAAVTSTDPSGSITACGPLACVIAGSAVPLADGNIMTIPLNVALGAKLGATPIPLTGLIGATLQGFAVNPAPVSGTAYSITVVASPCDLNGDGTVNIADVQAAINGTIGTGSCPITTANGGCSVVTIQEIVIAVNGGACKIP